MVTLARLQHVEPYISDLRSQIGYYTGWIPGTSADAATADDFYEIIRKDMEVKRCSNLLSLMSAGEVVQVFHPNPKIQTLANLAIANIREFLHARKSLIEKGMVFGLGIHRKFYEKTELEGFCGKWSIVKEMMEVDRRRLRIERNVDTKQTYWTLWVPEFDAHVVLEDLAVNPNAPYAIQNYLWYIQEYEELSPYFEGYGDVLYPMIWAKKNVIQYWSDLCESWAKPFLTILVDIMKSTMNTDVGGTFNTFEKRREELINIFGKCRARHIAVVDKNEEIKFHEQGSVGANILQDFIEYVDKKINLLFFGTDLATTTDGKGSYALGSIHKEAKDTIILYNRDRLGDVIKYDVVYDFFYRNINMLTKNNLDMPRPQQFKVFITTDVEELKKQAAREEAKEGKGTE